MIKRSGGCKCCAVPCSPCSTVSPLEVIISGVTSGTCTTAQCAVLNDTFELNAANLDLRFAFKTANSLSTDDCYFEYVLGISGCFGFNSYISVYFEENTGTGKTRFVLVVWGINVLGAYVESSRWNSPDLSEDWGTDVACASISLTTMTHDSDNGGCMYGSSTATVEAI